MSETETTSRDAWILRVLGVTPGTESEDTPQTGSKPDIRPGFVKMQKARLAWDSARKKVAAQLDEFRAQVEEDFAGDEAEDDVLDSLDELDDITLGFDDRIIDTLDALLDDSTDEAEREALLDEARGLLADYESFAGSNDIFKSLDGQTAFGVTLSVNQTMMSALQQLREALV